MSYNKFSAAQLFDGYNFLPTGTVLITSVKGEIIDTVISEDAGDDVQHLKGILSPGFINCHCHLELSHLKNTIPQQTGLVNFLQHVMSNIAASNEEKLAAMQSAENELYKTGIVAVGDICNTADTIPIKQHSKIHWHNFIEVSGFVETGAQKRLKEIRKIADQFSIFNFQFSTVPHAPYSVSKKLFELLNTLPNNNLISIHKSLKKNKRILSTQKWDY